MPIDPMQARRTTIEARVQPVAGEEDWEAVVAIRSRVFIEEQACPPKEEWDEFDESSRHFLLRAGSAPVGTARWRACTFGERIVAKLERFAVLREFRGKGYGRLLVRHLIDDAQKAGFAVQLIHAQAHLELFYASLGFAPTGRPPFDEVGIPHVEMIRHT